MKTKMTTLHQHPAAVVAAGCGPISKMRNAAAAVAGQAQQEPQAQQKVQKGWLSRWTRKQWSRHWFVLKAGSLTYYRGPAAELCSFLDGVLDLSLIKHIEVAQHEETVQQQQHAAQSPSQLFGGWQNQASQQQQQQAVGNQQQAHFNFTLKMWNGECHVLSAPSAAERQLWLASINAMTNSSSAGSSSGGSSNEEEDELSCGRRASASLAPKTNQQCDFNASERRYYHDDDDDDDAATDDSTASSTDDSSPALSNLSAKSQVIGGQTSDKQPKAAATAPANLTNTSKFYTLNNYQQNQQKQQQLEVEISLEQLAMRLKSAVRRRREEEELARELQRTKNELDQPTRRDEASEYSSQKQAATASQQPSKVQSVAADQEQEEAHNQALKRRLMCSQSSSSSSSTTSLDNLKQIESKAECEQRSKFTKILGDTGDPKQSVATCHSILRDHGTTNPDERPAGRLHRLSIDSIEDFVMEDVASAATSRPMSLSPALVDNQQQPNTTQRQKKQVRFDLSLSTQRQIGSSASETSSSSSVGSASSAEEEEDDDDDDSSDDSSTLSSPLSSDSASEEEENEEDEPDKKEPEVVKDLIDLSGKQVDDKDQRATSVGRSISDERRQELRRQLATRFSQEEDDQQSTSELVRNMIARRNKLRSSQGAELASKLAADEGETSQTRQTPNVDDHLMPDEGAISGCASQPAYVPLQEDAEMAVREEDEEEASCSTSKDNHELESRLELAQTNIGQLEKRLSDSFESYQMLELSYKQLQSDLIRCDELHKGDLSRMQTRINQLTLDLEASEQKLAEAREKLISYEQQVSSADQQQQQVDEKKENVSPATGNSGGQSRAFNWITRTMLANQHKGECGPIAHKLHHANHHHQPLLLMHHFKQLPAMNQQNLSLKLLNQSKQIQRKLNELELKVDKLQQSPEHQHRASADNN